MTRRKLEQSLYQPVSRYVDRRGFRLQHAEMRFYEYRIDLFGFSRAQDLTVAIELKLTKWKRAFEQAVLYQLCSDLVYIAVPKTTVSRVDLALLRQHGVGLISVDLADRCREVLSAEPSDVLRASYRETFIAVMKK